MILKKQKNLLTTINTQSNNARIKSVQSILCITIGGSLGDVEFGAIVEFVTSNESIMVPVDVAIVVAAKITDFSEKLSNKKSA